MRKLIFLTTEYILVIWWFRNSSAYMHCDLLCQFCFVAFMGRGHAPMSVPTECSFVTVFEF